jgi:hypothetical protein
MVRNSTLVLVGVGVLAFLFLGRSGGSGGDDGMGSDTSPLNPTTFDLNLADPSIDPPATDYADPTNTVQEGAVYQGPDPLNLAPGEGGNDLVAPVNPGNLVAGGPLYTGPDPLGLGGD